MVFLHPFSAIHNSGAGIVKALDAVHRLIAELDCLETGKEAAANLVEYGPNAIEPLRAYLLKGKPCKIFQPRFWAVQALGCLGAKEILLEYLSQEREIPDPEDRFGEEAVESAAARSLAAWPDEEMFQSLLKLSERRMLNGLIEALAAYKRPATIPYFERALEDDFYRATAEKAFQELGQLSYLALARSAVTPRPDACEETPSSLERRRSAVRLLNEIGMTPEYWPTLRRLLHESDGALVVGASKLGVSLASREDLMAMTHRLIALLASGPWHLQEDVERLLVALEQESAQEISNEIAWRMAQPADVRAGDERLRALLRVRRRLESA